MKTLYTLRYFFGTPLIYLLPSLLGWGLGDLAGYFASGPRLAYAVVVMLLGVGVAIQGVLAPAGIKGSGGETGQRVGRQTVVKVILILVMYAGLIFLPYADRRALAVWSGSEALRWLGAALTAAGFGLVLWSGIALGRFYSPDVTLQHEHRLITTGLYSVLRHPRYLGVLLATLGLALLYRSWAGLGLFAPMLGIVLFRIHDEEALLQQTFGAEWEAYCRCSWRLAPYVY